ncbi:hypothetical protein PRIPAC_87050 [Pristionchus pacificus]|uniref:Uncharacterized protein n=1 Tax=Pristionchus pacificus TaxID=54126 RepID=A0A2A6BLA2_PRIPA|nr:hypothetical protein PRIPAC_87050 [Pristionchus pacificus]|eukprot:PDM66593.1 hypothetical protein PRIPAC_48010 [Pristionchus pacificus]
MTHHVEAIQDHFSNLSNDAIFDIFSRLTQNDLDEMSTLSNRMRMLTIASRSRALRVEATDLTIMQPFIDNNSRLHDTRATKRINYRVEGDWEFRTSRVITRADIEAAMEWNMAYVSLVDGYRINLNDYLFLILL